MKDIDCVAIVVPRSNKRFSTYARFYALNLLKKNIRVILLSPDHMAINEQVQRQAGRHSAHFYAAHISEEEFDEPSPGVFDTLGRWNYLNRKLKAAERAANYPIGFVFFCPVDPLVRPYLYRNLVNWSFPWKWSGIYLNPDLLREKKLALNTDPRFSEPDYVFTSNHCVGVCVLDRFIIKPLQSRIYKKVVIFPELSDVSVPARNSEYAAEIKRAAKGRLVVGLLGVEKHEGITAFIKLIRRVDMEKFFFVFAGRLDLQDVEATVREEIEEFITVQRDNVLFLLKDLSNEEVNLLYKEIDISYLYFYNYHSSNHMLTKAAFFNKPILANKDFCVGETVKKFKLGLSVNGKMEESVDALEFMRLEKFNFKIFDEKDFEEYFSLQNEEHLDLAFEQIMLF